MLLPQTLPSLFSWYCVWAFHCIHSCYKEHPAGGLAQENPSRPIRKTDKLPMTCYFSLLRGWEDGKPISFLRALRGNSSQPTEQCVSEPRAFLSAILCFLHFQTASNLTDQCPRPKRLMNVKKIMHINVPTMTAAQRRMVIQHRALVYQPLPLTKFTANLIKNITALKAAKMTTTIINHFVIVLKIH